MTSLAPPWRPATGVRRRVAGADPSAAAPVAVLAVLVAVYVVLVDRPQWQVPLLRGFTVLLLTVLPGLLYLRFVRIRLLPLSTEYVYNLHRLRLDDPAYLPRPPAASKFYERWRAAGGEAYAGDADGVYRLKFQSQYGGWPRADDEQRCCDRGALLSVYVCTAVVGVAVCSVVWAPPTAAGASRLHAALGFGVLGAYFFVLSALLRRYFQNDLRPAAYLAAAVRLITTLLLVLAVVQVLPGGDGSSRRLSGLAFVIGVFPSVALQLLRRGVGRVTGWARGGLEPPFPLSQLDGMDVWTENRLLEVGIEDVQHLATANLVDLSLTTRLPMQRVVDWVDQSLLLLHAGLPRRDNRDASTYRELRELGVRSASELVVVVERLGLDLARRDAWPVREDPVLGALVAPADGGGAGARTGLLTRAALIAWAVADEPNAVLVRNWKLDGDPPAAGAAVPAAA